MSFGERLRKARENAGLSQRELAQACGLGDAAQGRIGNYEGGLREPTLDVIDRMAVVLGVSAAELAYPSLGLTNDEARLLQAYRLADSAARSLIHSTVDVVLRQQSVLSGRRKKSTSSNPSQPNQ